MPLDDMCANMYKFIITQQGKELKQEDFLGFFAYFMYSIQHCFICCSSDSTVPRMLDLN